MRRNQIPGKHEETRGKKRREETEKRNRRKNTSVSAYFSANIAVRAILNCLFFTFGHGHVLIFIELDSDKEQDS